EVEEGPVIGADDPAGDPVLGEPPRGFGGKGQAVGIDRMPVGPRTTGNHTVVVHALPERTAAAAEQQDAAAAGEDVDRAAAAGLAFVELRPRYEPDQIEALRARSCDE